MATIWKATLASVGKYTILANDCVSLTSGAGQKAVGPDAAKAGHTSHEIPFYLAQGCADVGAKQSAGRQHEAGDPGYHHALSGRPAPTPRQRGTLLSASCRRLPPPGQVFVARGGSIYLETRGHYAAGIDTPFM